MVKTLTLKLDENIFNLFKTAATGERRTISNFIEFATLSYLTNKIFVSDREMNEILNDKNLVKSLNKGLKQAEKFVSIPRIRGAKNKSPLDIKGVDLNISKQEILDVLKEVRSR